MTVQTPENQPENVASGNGPEIDYDKLSKSVADAVKGVLPTATAPAAQPSASSSDESLRVAIDAMPEKIVNGIKEAFVKPTTTETTTTQQTATTETQQEPGKPKSLAGWWFGK